MAQSDTINIIGPSINGLVSANTTVLTPVNNFRVTELAIEILTVTGGIAGSTVSLGVTGATYIDLAAALALPLLAVGGMNMIPLVTSPAIVPAGTPIVLKVVAGTATTLTFRVHQTGYFVE